MIYMNSKHNNLIIYQCRKERTQSYTPNPPSSLTYQCERFGVEAFAKIRHCKRCE